MLKILFILFLLVNLVLSLFPEKCFDNVSFIVYRDSKKIIVQLADSINDEKFATEIIAENQRIPVLQTGCFKNLPELKYITVNECGLQNIEKNAFLDLPRLRVISLTFNDFKVIRNGVFHSLDIVKLKLIANGIEEIEQHAFYNLTSLEVLDLSRNNLYSVKPDVFFKTNNLRQINLSNNKLLFVYDFFFYDCYTVPSNFSSIIDLSSNNISEIGRNAFKGVYTVDTLLLSDNKIRKIDPNVFQDFEEAKTLDLRGNVLKKVPNKVLYGPFEEVLYDEDQLVEDSGDINNPDLSVSDKNLTFDAKNETNSLNLTINNS